MMRRVSLVPQVLSERNECDDCVGVRDDYQFSPFRSIRIDLSPAMNQSGSEQRDSLLDSGLLRYWEL